MVTEVYVQQGDTRKLAALSFTRLLTPSRRPQRRWRPAETPSHRGESVHRRGGGILGYDCAELRALCALEEDHMDDPHLHVFRVTLAAVVTLAMFAPGARAQEGRGAPPPQFVSPDVAADRRITFRVFAPQAQAMTPCRWRHPRRRTDHAAHQRCERRVGGDDRPGRSGRVSVQLQRRRRATIDPRSPSISESNNNVWSLVHVPGADFMDTKRRAARRRRRR